MVVRGDLVLQIINAGESNDHNIEGTLSEINSLWKPDYFETSLIVTIRVNS